MPVISCYTGRGVRLHHGLHLLKAFGAIGHERLVMEVFPDDDVTKAVEKGDIRTRPLGEMEGGDSCQLYAPGIRHNQLGAPAHRSLDAGADDRMLLRGIGSDDEKCLCFGQILDAVGHRPAAE